MAPMRFERWWPEGLGEPSTSGGSNGLRYAFFPEARRLVIERDGRRTSYDTGSHRIGGVSSQQQNGGEPQVSFSSQHGAVRLEDLRRVDGQDERRQETRQEARHEAPGEDRHEARDDRREAQHAHPHDDRGPRLEPQRQQRPQERHHERHEERAQGERVVFSEEAGAGGIRLMLRGAFDVDMIEALEDFLRRQKRRLSRAE